MFDAVAIFVVGIAFGIVCKLLNLPIPAPPVFTGILGILGIYVGYKIVG